MPDFFRGTGGFCYISTRFPELLSSFALGQVQFHQMSLYEKDGITKRPDPPFYLFNILERKPDCVVIEDSDLEDFSGRWRPTNDEISFSKFTVNAGAASGSDLWIDPQVIRTAFFSDRLVKAIEEEKIRGLKFFPCRVKGYLH